MNRYCFTLDLIDDPELIREYEELHKKYGPKFIPVLSIRALKLCRSIALPTGYL